MNSELPLDSGSTAWMLASSALVLLMVPGLAMFYAGMVRRKNIIATMMFSHGAMAAIGVRGQPVRARKVSRLEITIGVNDDYLDPAVAAIVRGARSGDAGAVGGGRWEDLRPPVARLRPDPDWGAGRDGDLGHPGFSRC